MRNRSVMLVVTLVSSIIVDGVQAQELAKPSPSLLRFLGVTPTLTGSYDALANRRGNRPGLERRGKMGRVKRIADPAFLPEAALEPPKLLQTAAEIKLAEDLAPQKIKALKYLGEIGCGCYDQDGKVTAALIEGMKDCTTDVRLAAIESISEGACSEYCVFCSQRKCCNPETAKVLDQMANGQDENGCWLEPSAEVRAAAAEALAACGPVLVGSEEVKPETEETTPNLETIPDQTEQPESPEVGLSTPREPAELPAAPLPAPLGAPRSMSYVNHPESRLSSPATRQVSAARIALATDDANSSAPQARGQVVPAAAPLPQKLPKSSRPNGIRPVTHQGVVERIDSARGLLVVRFDHQGTVPRETAVSIVHSTFLGLGKKFSGTIVHWDEGVALVRPFYQEAFEELARGDRARMFITRGQPK